MELTAFLDKLHNVKKQGNGFMASCPSHDDKEQSLSITAVDGKILLNCFAMCKTDDIVKSLGLQMGDLFTDSKPKPRQKRIVKEYNYTDESGQLLYQVCRMDPKSFAQRHKNEKGEWQWGITGIRKVLYHLHDLVKTPEGDPVYFVEGEKDCDALWDCGLVATTSPGGANAWKDEYIEPLIGKKVVLIPDNDDAGYAHMRNVACALMGKAELFCILLPDKDVSVWLERHHSEELPNLIRPIDYLLEGQQPSYELIDEAIMWQKKPLIYKAETVRQERTGIHAKASILHNFTPLAWSVFNVERHEERGKLARTAYKLLPKELTKGFPEEQLKREFDLFCAGLWHYHVSHYSPELIYGDEHPAPLSFLLQPYILQGGGTIIFAPPGRGKSYSGMLWAQSINEGVKTFWQVKKAPVLYINLERSKASMERRLSNINKVLGLPAQTPLRILNARGKSLNEISAACRKAIRQHGIKVIFLDSISRAGFGGLIDDRPVNATIDALSGICETWVAIAHSPRADETHLFGSVMFEAGADIVVRLSSEISDNGTLGLGYDVTKANDMALGKQTIWAMEFTEEAGLVGMRRGRPYEFPEIEGKSKKSTMETIKDYIFAQDSADATATQVADATGLNRSVIATILSGSGNFVSTRREGRQVFYGVKE